MIQTPTRKWLELRGEEEGGDERENEGSRGLCRGWGQVSGRQRHPFHSALALDPETVAAAEARAPVPGILARILRENVQSQVGQEAGSVIEN